MIGMVNDLAVERPSSGESVNLQVYYMSCECTMLIDYDSLSTSS